MIRCPKCKVENDEDSFFCKRCGFPLDENPENYNQNRKTKNKKSKNKKIKKSKVKTKIKYKNNNEKQKGKMSFFQSFMMFFFILLSICALTALAILGYYIYQNSNIEVPNVVGYTSKDAQLTLKENKLQTQIIEKKTTNEDEVGIVLKQSKKEGTKVMENTIIKLTVGILDSKITVPNVENIELEKAIEILNKNNLKFKIEYQISDEEENIVLKQNIKPNKKIENTEIITITVSKKEKLDLPNTDENNQQENNDTTQTDDQITQN